MLNFILGVAVGVINVGIGMMLGNSDLMEHLKHNEDEKKEK